MKKAILILSFLFPSLSFAGVSVFAGQGYGSFRLSGAGSSNMASVMLAGIKFSEYFDFRYMSLDTSLRMPLLPFRIIDMRYAKSGNTYTYYDSDVFGLSFNIPFNEHIRFGLMYGLGKLKIYEMTEQSSGEYTANIHKGLLHAVNAELVGTFDLNVLRFSPTIGVLTHFLDKDAGYDNAMSIYLGLSVSYIFKGKDQD